MSDTGQTRRLLEQLHGRDLRLSIDDFGTGYSSLAYLSRLPVNEIKIDKGFVMGMFQNAADRLIVDATIGLGHNLRLEVVAEGVETEAMLAALRRQGCDFAQGYHVSRPLRPADFVHWLGCCPWRPARPAA
jgi:EAL domain-containing protein (putative c-di-GMP-specific phosphodiesterase class I)